MRFFRSLSGRLLIVTIAVVMLAEIAIFVPSVSRFRQDYLIERVRRAEIAALTVLAAPDRMVSPELEAMLIARAEVLNIVVRHDGRRDMVLTSPKLGAVMTTFDLRAPSTYTLIADALAQIAAPRPGVIRVVALAPSDKRNELEITLNSAPLTRAMRQYGLNILWLSLVISLSTAAMVFYAVRRAVVRPVTKLIDNLHDFSEAPQDASRIIHPQSHVSEIEAAEHAVADMQRQVLGALNARARLASLGEAVAKISHDLRNILGTTQLMADRLENSRDPIVARTAPKLIASLDRAIRLCQSTLTYGKAEEAPPEPRAVDLHSLTDEVIDGLGLTEGDPLVRIERDMEAELLVEADPEQLYRVLSNLVRNAAEAIRASGRPGQLTLAAERKGTTVEISVADTGPGLPAKAREHLFQPFRGGTRREGTGLGLAIAHELVSANGGELVLVSSTTAGTTFRITLPVDAAEAAA